jgi:cytochrome c nitrite reductase small subunit
MIAASAKAMVILGSLIGVACGVGGYTFIYAKGASYLTNNPAACANCHIMQDHYDRWSRSSHHQVATCNDCHTPHGFIPKYATKANNGFWHSFAFTTGRYPDPIVITPRNRDIADRACRKCHAQMVDSIEEPHGSEGRLSCIRCHSTVGHPK